MWTRDGGEWIGIAAFKRLVGRKKARVIDCDFNVDDSQIADIRALHINAGAFFPLSEPRKIADCAKWVESSIASNYLGYPVHVDPPLPSQND